MAMHLYERSSQRDMWEQLRHTLRLFGSQEAKMLSSPKWGDTFPKRL